MRSMDRAVVVQFIQFCLVGALSTALNEALFNLFWMLGLNRDLSFVLAFSLAVTNGFFLNRAWTFRRSRGRKMERQYLMFFAVNVVGLGLSWVVMRVSGAWLLQIGWAQPLALWLQQWAHRAIPADRVAYSLGVLISTAPCAVWNFSANKLWTFGGGAAGEA
jgi:putative flippase GtrA